MKRPFVKRKKMTSGTQSTQPKAETKLLRPNTLQAIPLDGMYPLTIRNLSYGDFIRINLNQKDKPEDWVDIVEEYVSLIETEKSKDIFSLWKKINETRLNLSILEICLDALSGPYYHEPFALKISELGFSFVVEDRSNIEIVRNEIGVLVVLLNQWKQEYDQLTKQANGQGVRDEMGYEKEIYSVCSGLRVNIDKDKISCFSYAAILNTYIDKSNAEQEAYNKMKESARRR